VTKIKDYTTSHYSCSNLQEARTAGDTTCVLNNCAIETDVSLVGVGDKEILIKVPPACLLT
jgi:hypothetical protein